VGAREVSVEEGKSAFRDALIRKTRINIHLDNDVLAYFRKLAGDRGYQTLINRALRRELNAENERHQLRELTNEVRRLTQEIKNHMRTHQIVNIGASADQQYSYDVPELLSTGASPQRQLYEGLSALPALRGLSASYGYGQQRVT